MTSTIKLTSSSLVNSMFFILSPSRGTPSTEGRAFRTRESPRRIENESSIDQAWDHSCLYVNGPTDTKAYGRLVSKEEYL